ncbi:helix-turn-helix domain-containing protein [Mesorhizobium sp. M0618]|uniref:helix-turn-helix domain-containing protein n=1 Tax=unclassified Mesorhizobium TaxID=325217 RepID=UPI003334C02F
MDGKLEFVRFAVQDGSNVSALCRRFGIGRTCGHKLIARYRAHGEAGLRSNRAVQRRARRAARMQSRRRFLACAGRTRPGADARSPRSCNAREPVRLHLPR